MFQVIIILLSFGLVAVAEPPVNSYLPPTRSFSAPSSQYGAPGGSRNSFSSSPIRSSFTPSFGGSSFGGTSFGGSSYSAPSTSYGAPSSSYGAPGGGYNYQGGDLSVSTTKNNRYLFLRKLFSEILVNNIN